MGQRLVASSKFSDLPRGMLKYFRLRFTTHFHFSLLAFLFRHRNDKNPTTSSLLLASQNSSFDYTRRVLLARCFVNARRPFQQRLSAANQHDNRFVVCSAASMAMEGRVDSCLVDDAVDGLGGSVFRQFVSIPTTRSTDQILRWHPRCIGLCLCSQFYHQNRPVRPI